MDRSEMIGCIKGLTLVTWVSLQQLKKSVEDGFLDERFVAIERAKWCVLDDLCQTLGIGDTTSLMEERRFSELPFADGGDES